MLDVGEYPREGGKGFMTARGCVFGYCPGYQVDIADAVFANEVGFAEVFVEVGCGSSHGCG